MSQSIKRDGWYFRSFGYIKRKLSILALYYFPSFRTLGPGNRKAVESTAGPHTYSRHGRLCAEDPGWPTPWFTVTHALFIWSETRTVTVHRRGGESRRSRGSRTEASWGLFPKYPSPSHPPPFWYTLAIEGGEDMDHAYFKKLRKRL